MTRLLPNAEKSTRHKGQEIDQEAQAARTLINAIIADTSTVSDNFRLGRIDDRIENVNERSSSLFERRDTIA